MLKNEVVRRTRHELYSNAVWSSIDHFRNGLLHRTNDPAQQGGNGYKTWWEYGVRHRKDGPAVSLAIGGKEYYVRGQ
jgi:hypothetical protein